MLESSGFLRIRQIVGQLLPVTKSTLYRWIKAGKFPKPIHLSQGADRKQGEVSLWRVSDVEKWLKEAGQEVQK